MGVLRDTHRTPRSSLKAKMLAIILSSSLAALVAGSALPHPEMPPLQERGECMAWSWSSTTGWKCTQEINTDPVDVNKFRQDSLTAHNVYRAKHGVAALTLSNELNAVAQEWADYLIAQGTFEHRPNNKYGENIYMSSGSAAQDQAQGAVDSWYSEIKDYTLKRTKLGWTCHWAFHPGCVERKHGGWSRRRPGGKQGYCCCQLFTPWQLCWPVC